MMDYRALGLKCGLEIHQQLDTRKLFCEDPSYVSTEPPRATFRRRLRPTQSELGEVDAAALEEARRHLLFAYEATENSCLVEADEEPPHAANPEALDIVLTIALLLKAQPVREVHFMRKIVIDGSNTAGFQRSALVALNGSFAVDGKVFGVPTILLEEDAARKVGEGKGEVAYRLDRLGIPLVEIATTPDIESPEEAERVALHLGSLLRATRRVRRGIGTIREDLNVSIRGGARIEIKGVQELRMIPEFVATEVARQLALIEAARTLAERGARPTDLEVVDVTDSLRETLSKPVASELARGGVALGARLAGFAGLLKERLGPELATHARVAGVRGILHSDELPGYAITDREVDAVRRTLGCNEHDAFVLVAADEARAAAAFREIGPRVRAAFTGVPEETREPRADGTTVYARPLPGKARMYPETDVPPIRIADDRLASLAAKLPEPPATTVQRLTARYSLHAQQARQLVEDGVDDVFEEIAEEFGEPKLAATILLVHMPEIRREGLDVDAVPSDYLRELVSLVKGRTFAKEAVPNVLRSMARTGSRAGEAAAHLGLTRASPEEIDRVVGEIVAANRALIEERGENAESALMGLAMERLRGRADGRAVNEALRRHLRDMRPA